MLAKFFNWFRWLYWKLNRRFLEAYSETLVGYTDGELHPNGKAIVDYLFTFLAEVPANVFRQSTLMFMVLPLAVAEKLPRGTIMRALVKIWLVIKGQFMRRKFRKLSKVERVQFVDHIYKTLARQAGEEEDDLLKAIVILINFKYLINGSFMELDSTWKALRYSPYPVPKKPWAPPSGDQIVKPPRTAIGEYLHQNVKTAREVRKKEPGRTNYLVIGSGAGGAVVARSIQEHDPNARIVILESGPLVTNEAFPTRITEASAELYMNAGVTLSKDMLLVFRQGRLVGGSTVLNNSVSIKPEGFWWDDVIVKRWQLAGAPLEWGELHRAYDEVMATINVHPLEQRVITDQSRVVADSFRKAAPELNVIVSPSNTKNCIGCGRCNAGCQYDAKQSMLITYIPDAMKAGALLVPDTHARELKITQTSKGLTVPVVEVKTSKGEIVEIEADKVVLAAGAYASSKLLWKSGFTGLLPGNRTVGQRFTSNFGSPMFGRFPQALNGWAGQQIGFMVQVPEENVVIETAFGPPSVMGLTISQWGENFMRLVKQYDHLCTAVPVWGASYGAIDRGYLPTLSWALDYRLGGFVIDYKLGGDDWMRLLSTLKLTAKALIEMGAEEVFDTRFDGATLKRGDDLDAYFNGRGPIDYMNIQTAHLQGGNVIHTDPQQGVVDTNFKVHGFDNVYVADASVVPSPITVNLQLTVMALARYAAPRIVRS